MHTHMHIKISMEFFSTIGKHKDIPEAVLQLYRQEATCIRWICLPQYVPR